MRKFSAVTLTLGMSLGAVLLSGCSSSSISPKPSQESTSVVYRAEYPSYKSLAALESAADLVVEMRRTGEQRTVLLEPVAPENLNDPLRNPELGVDPVSGGPTPPPVVTTIYTAVVTDVIKGSINVGSVIEVKELGGNHDGVQYVAEGDTSLAAADSYLVFLAGDGTDAYSLLNPGEAKYPEDTAGDLEPLAENDIAVSTEQLEEYAQ